MCNFSMGLALKATYELGATILGAWVREFRLPPKNFVYH